MLAIPPSPPPSSPEASARLATHPSRDTKPELALRRELHARGLRYRVHWRLPFDRRRHADVAFTRRKVAVFVDGCWWHGCPAHWRPPNANADWWTAKVEGNRRRDADTDRRLAEAGWAVVRVWAHERPDDVADRVEALVRSR